MWNYFKSFHNGCIRPLSPLVCLLLQFSLSLCRLINKQQLVLTLMLVLILAFKVHENITKST